MYNGGQIYRHIFKNTENICSVLKGSPVAGKILCHTWVVPLTPQLTCSVQTWDSVVPTVHSAVHQAPPGGDIIATTTRLWYRHYCVQITSTKTPQERWEKKKHSKYACLLKCLLCFQEKLHITYKTQLSKVLIIEIKIMICILVTHCGEKKDNLALKRSSLQCGLQCTQSGFSSLEQQICSVCLVYWSNSAFFMFFFHVLFFGFLRSTVSDFWY